MSEQLVTTKLGHLPEAQFSSVVTEQDEGTVIMMAREWTYIGNDPALAEHVGQVVRRDVWANMKCGLVAGAEQGV